MMISPGAYIKQFENADYMELIEERNRLISFINWFEMNEYRNDRSSDEWKYKPSPETRYRMYFHYLALICFLMHDKYGDEYVTGKHSLARDYQNRIQK